MKVFRELPESEATCETRIEKYSFGFDDFGREEKKEEREKREREKEINKKKKQSKSDLKIRL